MNAAVSVSVFYFLSPVFRFLHKIRARHGNPPVVLVWYTGKLGDIVCLTGVLKALRETQPGRRIALIARAPFTDVLARNPNLDDIISFKSNRDFTSWSWMRGVWKRLSAHPVQDIHVLVENREAAVGALWFHAETRHLLVTVNRRSTSRILARHYSLHPFPYSMRIKHWYLSEFARVEPSDERYPNELFFPGSLESVDRVWERSGLAGRSSVIGVLPSSGKSFKRWPESRWRELIRLLEAQGYGIVFFGAGREESEMIGRLRDEKKQKSLAVINEPLTVVPYYLKKCSLVVGVDTGLLYVADALGVPVVDIMGPVDEVQQRPEHLYRLVVKSHECPKIVKTPPQRVFSQEDLALIKRCFDAITAKDVFNAINETLSSS